MPFPPLSSAHKDRIQQHILHGRAVASIAALENVGKSSVYRIIDNLRAFGTHTPPPAAATTRKRGRPCAISPAARIGLRAFVEGRPGARQDEMQGALLDSFDLKVSQPTISNTLRAMKIGRKRGRGQGRGVSASGRKRDSLDEICGEEAELVTGLCEPSP